MTPRAKRKREKQRSDNSRYALLAARATEQSELAEPYKHRYFDGKLVHEMLKDRRTFNRGYARFESDWTTQTVFSTKCGVVVAVGEPRYAFAKKPTTCIECLSLPRRNLSLEEYLEVLRTTPWTA